MYNRICYAQIHLNKFKIEYNIQIHIAQLCSELYIDGLRGDIVINRARCAFIVFDKYNKYYTIESVRRITLLCLNHRLRNDPLEKIDYRDKVVRIWSEIFNRSSILQL